MQLEEITYLTDRSIEMYSEMINQSTQEIKEYLIEEWTKDKEE